MQNLDLMSARRRARRDGKPAYSVAEAAPSRVVHLFHPGNPAYDAAEALFHEALRQDAHRRDHGA